MFLDPFVRLHRIDENASGDVAPLLAYLRELQLQHALSVVVHHAKKGAGRVRAGQAEGFVGLRRSAFSETSWSF
jgi:hypothetical protein